MRWILSCPIETSELQNVGPTCGSELLDQCLKSLQFYDRNVVKFSIFRWGKNGLSSFTRHIKLANKNELIYPSVHISLMKSPVTTAIDALTGCIDFRLDSC